MLAVILEMHEADEPPVVAQRTGFQRGVLRRRSHHSGLGEAEGQLEVRRVSVNASSTSEQVNCRLAVGRYVDSVLSSGRLRATAGNRAAQGL